MLLAESGVSWQVYQDDLTPHRLNAEIESLSVTLQPSQPYLVFTSAPNPARGRLRLTQPPVAYTNPLQRTDVDGNGTVEPLDALIGINDLNARGSRRLTESFATTYYLDMNGAGVASPIDVLIVVNDVNADEPEGEFTPAVVRLPTTGVAPGEREFRANRRGAYPLNEDRRDHAVIMVGSGIESKTLMVGSISSDPIIRKKSRGSVAGLDDDDIVPLGMGEDD